MAKIIKILCAIIFGVSLAFGASASSVFAKFDKDYVSASKNEKKAMHMELKNIYTSLGKNEKTARTDALKRLVYSSEILGYSNLENYKKELNALGAKADYKPKIDANAKKNLSADDLEILGVSKTKNEQTNQHTNKNEKLVLQSISGDKNSVRVQFNRDLDESEYKNFTISSSDSFRFVLDFQAKQNSAKTRIKGTFIDEVRTSQYNDTTARVVLNHKEKFNANIDIDGSTLIITKSNSAQNTTTKKSKKIEKINKNASTQNKQNSTKSASSGLKTLYKSTKGKLIVIDPGHGGKDAGAIGNSLKEKNVVLATAKKLGALLQKRGYKVLYTRSTDVFFNLKSRTAFANKKKADMFISVHANASPSKATASKFSGVETFFLSPARSERSKNVAALENKGDIDDMNTFSKNTFLNFLNREKIIASNKLAIDIQGYMLNSVRKGYYSKDGGVREAPFWVLVGATMPAVLVEMGYISHPSEGKNLGKSAYQDRIAQGIANGVDAYFQKNK